MSIAIEFGLCKETGYEQIVLDERRADGMLAFVFPQEPRQAAQVDRRVLSGIFVNRDGRRWCDGPKDYGAYKTFYNRWKRWGEKGIFLQMIRGLAVAGDAPKTVMIDAIYLNAHRTASSLRGKKGILDASSAALKAA